VTAVAARDSGASDAGSELTCQNSDLGLWSDFAVLPSRNSCLLSVALQTKQSGKGSNPRIFHFRQPPPEIHQKNRILKQKQHLSPSPLPSRVPCLHRRHPSPPCLGEHKGVHRHDPIAGLLRHLRIRQRIVDVAIRLGTRRPGIGEPLALLKSRAVVGASLRAGRHDVVAPALCACSEAADEVYVSGWHGVSFEVGEGALGFKGSKGRRGWERRGSGDGLASARLSLRCRLPQCSTCVLIKTEGKFGQHKAIFGR
jgi:hypothetical protein